MFLPSFNSLAIKFCSNAYLLILDHDNIMGIRKTMPGENIIFPYSRYGSPKMAQDTQSARNFYFDSLLGLQPSSCV